MYQLTACLDALRQIAYSHRNVAADANDGHDACVRSVFFVIDAKKPFEFVVTPDCNG